ncbi:MAG TPA: DMT family transporter [Candidatus Dormibacteraeota bacterium]
MKPSRTDAVALAVVTVWGVNFAFLKIAVDQFQPLAFNFLRFAGMLVLAWAVVAVRRSPVTIPRTDVRRVVAAGIVGYTGYITLSIVGLGFTTAFSNAVLIAAAPIFTALLLWAWRVEAIGGVRALGLAISLAGVSAFVADKLGHGVGGAGLGDILSLAAAALYAGYTVLLKPLLARHPATSVTAWTLTAGAIPVFAICLPALLGQDWARVQWTGWAVLGWSIVGPVYVAWTLWSWVTARAGVARTNAFMFLVPVVGGAASVVLTGEGMGPAKLLGAGLVMAGLILVRRRSGRAPQPGRPQSEPVLGDLARNGAGERV